MDRGAGGLVSQRWAMRVPGESRRHIGALRRFADVLVHDGDELWLRGEVATPAVARALAMLPGAERFVVDDDGCCRAPGGRLPRALLPEGPWRALRDHAAIELAAPALPATGVVPATLTVVAGGGVAEPDVLATSLADLLRWADTALALRLRRLRFAADADGGALVHGQPLPPLPGPVWVACDGVALPAGSRLEPPLPPKVLARQLALRPGDLACFAPDGTVQIVPDEAFVHLSRSALRATLAEVPRGR